MNYPDLTGESNLVRCILSSFNTSVRLQYLAFQLQHCSKLWSAKIWTGKWFLSISAKVYTVSFTTLDLRTGWSKFTHNYCWWYNIVKFETIIMKFSSTLVFQSIAIYSSLIKNFLSKSIVLNPQLVVERKSCVTFLKFEKCCFKKYSTHKSTWLWCSRLWR